MPHDRLQRELASARRQDGGFAVLACDLAHFRAVDDAHGYPEGNFLLRAVANRLRG